MTRAEKYALELAARGEKPMRGVGDAVARATSILGIKPCGGCAERQARLNQMFPFGGGK